MATATLHSLSPVDSELSQYCRGGKIVVFSGCCSRGESFFLPTVAATSSHLLGHS
jgi:hypothetical protein